MNIARAISVEDLEKYLNDYKVKNNIKVFKDNNNLGYYLAGLLEHKKPELLKFSILKSINPLPVTVLLTSKRSKSTYRPESTCMALVVWGVNLYSGFRTLRLSNMELNMFKLPNHQKGVIVGLLLFYGWLSYASANNKYPRFGF